MSLYKDLRKRAALRKLGFLDGAVKATETAGKMGAKYGPGIAKTVGKAGKLGGKVVAGAGKAAWAAGVPILGPALTLAFSSGTMGKGLNKRFRRR